MINKLLTIQTGREGRSSRKCRECRGYSTWGRAGRSSRGPGGSGAGAAGGAGDAGAPGAGAAGGAGDAGVAAPNCPRDLDLSRKNLTSLTDFPEPCSFSPSLLPHPSVSPQVLPDIFPLPLIPRTAARPPRRWALWGRWLGRPRPTSRTPGQPVLHL